MARVYCIEWSDEDDAQGTQNVGWSLHASRTQAADYTRTHEARYDHHSDVRCVEVPQELWDAVRTSRVGVFWATPMACPFPAVSGEDIGWDLAVERDMSPVVEREPDLETHPARDDRARL